MNAMVESEKPANPDTPAADEHKLLLGDLLYGNGATHASESDWIALVEATANKDTRAFGELYMRMHGIVFAFLFRLTKDRTLAEELTVGSFHEVWSSAPGYEAALGSVVAWIMNLARARASARIQSVESPE